MPDIREVHRYLDLADIYLDLYGSNSQSALWCVKLAANELKNKHPFKGSIRQWVKELRRGKTI